MADSKPQVFVKTEPKDDVPIGVPCFEERIQGEVKVKVKDGPVYNKKELKEDCELLPIKQEFKSETDDDMFEFIQTSMPVAPPMVKPPIQQTAEETVDRAGKDECIEDSSNGEGEIKAGRPTLWCGGQFCGILFCEFSKDECIEDASKCEKILLCGGECGRENCNYKVPKHDKARLRSHTRHYWSGREDIRSLKAVIEAGEPTFLCGGEFCGMLYCDFKTTLKGNLIHHRKSYRVGFEQDKKPTLWCGGECGKQNCPYQTLKPKKLKLHKKKSSKGDEEIKASEPTL